MALLVVMATILVVMGLTSAILNIVSSHYRLTHHQVSRIQAYYASMAGINYAYEKLRTNDSAWKPADDETKTFFLCRVLDNCPPAPAGASSNKIEESNFPVSIQSVKIEVIGKDVSNCNPPPDDTGFCIKAAANYAYTNPP